MKKYHKIHSLYKRTPDKRIIWDQFSLPEFEYLANCPWNFYEKINGTNIRVLWNGTQVEFRGKTDNADIPENVRAVLQEHFTEDRVAAAFGSAPVCLYGEGYGAGVVKGSGNYGDAGFVLFDVKIDTWWLKRANVEDVAAKLAVPIVPLLGTGTLHDLVERCRAGFGSAWGAFRAEGIVAQPTEQLFNRKGERIITKLKCADFT